MIVDDIKNEILPTASNHFQSNIGMTMQTTCGYLQAESGALLNKSECTVDMYSILIDVHVFYVLVD